MFAFLRGLFACLFGGKVNFEEIDGVIAIHNRLYVKTPASLERLLKKLRSIGYRFDYRNNTSWLESQGPLTGRETSIEIMNRNRATLWSADLDGQSRWMEKRRDAFGVDICLRLPQRMTIYETWRWTLLESTPTLHEEVLYAVGINSDKGYYTPDGRALIFRDDYEEMGKFIRHFTTLDADAWDKESQFFRHDYHGCIDDLAKFCHPHAEVRDRPNLGNIIAGFAKAASGQELTDTEVKAMTKAANDPQERDTFLRAFGQE